MAGHRGLANVYGRGREAATPKVMGQCLAGRHKNCFSVRCECSCHNASIEKDDAKAAAKAKADHFHEVA